MSSFEDIDLLTEESWEMMGISGTYLSSTETQLENYDFKPRIAIKEPRHNQKARKTKKIMNPTKKRMEFLTQKGSRLYNKGRGINL